MSFKILSIPSMFDKELQLDFIDSVLDIFRVDMESVLIEDMDNDSKEIYINSMHSEFETYLKLRHEILTDNIEPLNSVVVDAIEYNEYEIKMEL